MEGCDDDTPHTSDDSWETVLSTPNALVLWQPHLHALSVLPHHSNNPRHSNAQYEPRPAIAGPSSSPIASAFQSGSHVCELCKRPFDQEADGRSVEPPGRGQQVVNPRYFSILSQVNSTLHPALPESQSSRSSSSRTPSMTPMFGNSVSSITRSSATVAATATPTLGSSPSRSSSTSSLSSISSTTAWTEQQIGSSAPSLHQRTRTSRQEETGDSQEGSDGYYKRYFKEEHRLGMGAQGTVFLCQHIIDHQPLGLYAVKKVAVGTSHEYLVQVLKEIKILEGLRHENIITLHFAWIEKTRFSSFGSPIQALHVLMQYANHGSLESWITARTSPPMGTDFEAPELSPAQAKAAFRARRKSQLASAGAGHAGGLREGIHRGETRGVHLLGRQEVLSVFGDVCKGLTYLHDHSVIHCDLKPGNVLLHLEEGEFGPPRALISDFGTASLLYHPDRARSGNTGTTEYCSPGSFTVDADGNLLELGNESDLWSLGMILHKIIFFNLPYSQTEDFDLLEKEIMAYPGFNPTPELVANFERRGLPPELLFILAGLLTTDPGRRLSCKKVLHILEVGLSKETLRHYPFSSSSSSRPPTFSDLSTSLTPFHQPLSSSSPSSSSPSAIPSPLSSTVEARLTTLHSTSGSPYTSDQEQDQDQDQYAEMKSGREQEAVIGWAGGRFITRGRSRKRGTVGERIGSESGSDRSSDSGKTERTTFRTTHHPSFNSNGTHPVSFANSIHKAALNPPYNISSLSTNDGRSVRTIPSGMTESRMRWMRSSSQGLIVLKLVSTHFIPALASAYSSTSTLASPAYTHPSIRPVQPTGGMHETWIKQALTLALSLLASELSLRRSKGIWKNWIGWETGWAFVHLCFLWAWEERARLPLFPSAVVASL
ncbi:kinase-like protein [Phaffia rhodozyma]|uniref:Kinase-like protein n=1 Tax=Phaffia rhodozyma TaxID=264483 RepID=A0A0F7SSR2_PHARH|nr:kinase-like protein [Phaffia rhodozyma]